MRVNEENKNEKNEKIKNCWILTKIDFSKKKFDPLISKKMVPGQNITKNEEKSRKKNKKHIKKTTY